ncbi:MAG TPA: copper transporter, partial [Actinomycetota bacterium]
GEEPTLPPEAFAVPLVERLAGLGVPVAAGESLLTDYPYVSLVRADGTDGAVTVDDLDQSMGGAALVLGLDDLLTSGSGGAYGVKDGAEPLPPAP